MHFCVENRLRLVTAELHKAQQNTTSSGTAVTKLPLPPRFTASLELLAPHWSCALLRLAGNKPLEPSARYFFRHQMVLALLSVQER
jgi:hypothetical protein